MPTRRLAMLNEHANVCVCVCDAPWWIRVYACFTPSVPGIYHVLFFKWQHLSLMWPSEMNDYQRLSRHLWFLGTRVTRPPFLDTLYPWPVQPYITHTHPAASHAADNILTQGHGHTSTHRARQPDFYLRAHLPHFLLATSAWPRFPLWEHHTTVE